MVHCFACEADWRDLKDALGIDARTPDEYFARLKSKRRRPRPKRAPRKDPPAETNPRAVSIVESCVLRTGHPYLAAKGLGDWHAPVAPDGRIVIPGYRDDHIVSCQRIDDRGQKRFLHGSRTRGIAYSLGSNDVPFFFVVEGYATAISVYCAMPDPVGVLVAFSAANIPLVASRQRGDIVVADYDKPSIDKARASGCLGWHPPAEMGDGADADDYRQMWGWDALQRELERMATMRRRHAQGHQ